MPSPSELSFIGKRDSTRNVTSASIGFPAQNIKELDGKALTNQRKDERKIPMQRAFELRTMQQSAEISKLVYTPFQHADALHHSLNGGSRQILLNGTFLQIGIQSSEGHGTSVRYDKNDGSLLRPPHFDPSLFSNISFDIQMDPSELVNIGEFFQSLRKLQTPNAEEFQNVLAIVDQTFPTTHQLQLL